MTRRSFSVGLALVVATGLPAARAASAAGVPICGAVTAGTTSDLIRGRPATAVNPLRVMIVGDSITYDAAPGIVAGLQSTGEARVSVQTVFGFGLAQTFYDWRQQWPRLLDQTRAEVVIVMFGGWDNAEMVKRGEAWYTKLVDEAVFTLHSRGAKLLWYGWPRSVYDGDPNRPIPRDVNRVYARLGARYPGVVTYRSSDPPLSPGATFSRTCKTGDGQLKVLRKRDGGHVCPDGAARMGKSAQVLLTPGFGLRQPDPAWTTWRWRTDARYNDPAGACRYP